MNRVLGSLVLLAGSIACVVGVAYWSGLDARTLMARLAGSPAWLIVAFIALTMAQIALSALKWRTVINIMVPTEGQPAKFKFFFNCSAISALLSQVLTTYAASIIVRSWAARRFHNVPLAKGAASSAIEQIFDVVILLVMVLATASVWFTGGSFAQWLIVMSVAIALGGLSIYGLRSLLSVVGHLHPSLASLAALQNSGEGARLFATPLMLRLYTLSFLRYVLMMIRAPLIVVALGFPILAQDAAQGFTIVQVTQLAAFTPGNLGLQEWGWTGVMAYLGYGAELGIEFALALRLIGFATMILAVALITLPSLRPRQVFA